MGAFEPSQVPAVGENDVPVRARCRYGVVASRAGVRLRVEHAVTSSGARTNRMGLWAPRPATLSGHSTAPHFVIEARRV